MRYSRLTSTSFLLRLEKGEEVMSSLSTFCTSLKIKNGVFWGIGSVESPTLAHYSVYAKKYTEKQLDGVYELVNLSGSVGCTEDGALLVHAHATLSDAFMNAFGGHVVKATVSATCEIVLTRFSTHYKKVYDEKIGLKLWDLEKV